MSNVPALTGRLSPLIQVLFAIQLVSMGAMEMSGPFWPVHLQSLHTSDFMFGFAGVMVYVGPMLGIMLTGAFWGRIGDRFGHKLMMIRALLGLSLTQLALAYSDDIWEVLTLRFVQGTCAGYIAPAQAYSVSIDSPLRRARLFAYLQVSTNVGSLAGAVVGGLILDYATFFWINVAASSLCAACALVAWLTLPDVPAAEKTTAAAPPITNIVHADAQISWRSSPISGLLGIIGILLLSRMITQTPFSLYVRSIFQVNNWVVGLCYGLQALGVIVSATQWARHFEKKSLSDTLRHITYIAAACAGLAAIAGATRHIGVFIGVYFAWGILLGATTPVLMSQLSKAAGSLRQGYILGVAHSAAQFSSISGIVLGGWLSQAAGLQYTYLLVAFSYATASIAALAMRRRNAAIQPSCMPPAKYRDANSIEQQDN